MQNRSVLVWGVVPELRAMDRPRTQTCLCPHHEGQIRPLDRLSQRFKPFQRSMKVMVTVLCNDSEIEVEDGEVCEICGLELEEFDQVTGTGIHGYYHWTCVTHVD